MARKQRESHPTVHYGIPCMYVESEQHCEIKMYSIFTFNLRIVDSEVSFKPRHLAMLMYGSEKLWNNVTCEFTVVILCVLEGDDIDTC